MPFNHHGDSMRQPRVSVIFLVVFIVTIISIAVIATAAPQAGTLTSGEPGMPGLTRALEVFPNNLSHADISGHRIVYSDYRDGNWDIFLFNHTSGREYQLTNDSYDQMNPTISCDLVAWYDNSTGAWDLVLLKLHGDDAAYAVCTGPGQGQEGCPAGVVCPPTSTPTPTSTPGAGPGPGPGNCSCTANFTWSPQGPGINDTVNFTDRTTVSGNCSIRSWAWHFGDGGSSTEQNPGHAYTQPGTYTVILDVTLNGGATCNASKDVTVSSPTPENCSCTASIAKDRDQAEPDQAVAFTGSAEVSGSCGIQGWAWDFGDGATGEGESVSHAYAAEGTYTVTLVVTLDDGSTCETSTTVTVVAPPEPCSCSASITTSGNSFHGDVDIQGDCSVTGWAWDFGDGTTGSGQDVTHDYTAEGTYTVTLVVTLDDGNTCQTTTQVFIIF